MRFFWRVASLSALLAISVRGGRNDNEEETGRPPVDNLRGDKNGEERDTEIIAEAMGVDVSTAKEHLQIQRNFKDLVKKLEKHEDFADSVMAKNPGDDLEIYFKTKVPTEFEEDIKAFKNNNKVNVQEKSTKKSLKEQEKVADKITKFLEKKGFSNVGYVLSAGHVQVLAETKKGDEDDMKDEKEINFEKLEKKAKKILRKLLDEDELDGVGLFISSESTDRDDHTRGGRQVYSSTSACTSGFSVVDSSGTTGIATAAHCNVNTYDTGQAGETDYAMTLQGEHNGSWGDFEWHTTTHWELPEFWATPDDLWYVVSVDSSFSRNDWVCVYSRMRGRRFCDQIENTNIKQGGTSRLVAMWHDDTVSGDSGGPWSWGSNAAGLVKGAKKYWTYCGFLTWCYSWHSTWSRASYLPNGLGVSVLVR